MRETAIKIPGNSDVTGVQKIALRGMMQKALEQSNPTSLFSIVPFTCRY